VGHAHQTRTHAHKHTIQLHESNTCPVQKSLFHRKGRTDSGSQLNDENDEDLQSDDPQGHDPASGAEDGDDNPTNYYLLRKFKDQLVTPSHCFSWVVRFLYRHVRKQWRGKWMANLF
jgi:hypothetical protein